MLSSASFPPWPGGIGRLSPSKRNVSRPVRPSTSAHTDGKRAAWNLLKRMPLGMHFKIDKPNGVVYERGHGGRNRRGEECRVSSVGFREVWQGVHRDVRAQRKGRQGAVRFVAVGWRVVLRMEDAVRHRHTAQRDAQGCDVGNRLARGVQQLAGVGGAQVPVPPASAECAGVFDRTND